MVFLRYFFNRSADDDQPCTDVLLQEAGDICLPCITGAAFLYAQLLSVYIFIYGCYQPFPFYRIWNARDHPEMEVF